MKKQYDSKKKLQKPETNVSRERGLIYTDIGL